jgi:hypothetical protein
MKREKLKSCCSVWHAYRDAFVEINYRLTLKPSLIAEADKEAFEAYRKIISYGRLWHNYSKKDISDPTIEARTDWELYKIAYGDVLMLYNHLNLIDNVGDFVIAYAHYGQSRRDLMIALQDILRYSCNKQLGSFDRSKVRNYISRLDGIINSNNRYKK